MSRLPGDYIPINEVEDFDLTGRNPPCIRLFLDIPEDRLEWYIEYTKNNKPVRQRTVTENTNLLRHQVVDRYRNKMLNYLVGFRQNRHLGSIWQHGQSVDLDDKATLHYDTYAGQEYLSLHYHEPLSIRQSEEEEGDYLCLLILHGACEVTAIRMKDVYKHDPDEWKAAYHAELSFVSEGYSGWDETFEPSLDYLHPVMELCRRTTQELVALGQSFICSEMNLERDYWINAPTFNGGTMFATPRGAKKVGSYMGFGNYRATHSTGFTNVAMENKKPTLYTHDGKYQFRPTTWAWDMPLRKVADAVLPEEGRWSYLYTTAVDTKGKWYRYEQGAYDVVGPNQDITYIYHMNNSKIGTNKPHVEPPTVIKITARTHSEETRVQDNYSQRWGAGGVVIKEPIPVVVPTDWMRVNDVEIARTIPVIKSTWDQDPLFTRHYSGDHVPVELDVLNGQPPPSSGFDAYCCGGGGTVEFTTYENGWAPENSTETYQVNRALNIFQGPEFVNNYNVVTTYNDALFTTFGGPPAAAAAAWLAAIPRGGGAISSASFTYNQVPPVTNREWETRGTVGAYKIFNYPYAVEGKPWYWTGTIPFPELDHVDVTFHTPHETIEFTTKSSLFIHFKGWMNLNNGGVLIQGALLSLMTSPEAGPDPVDWTWDDRYLIYVNGKRVMEKIAGVNLEDIRTMYLDIPISQIRAYKVKQ